MAEPNVPESPEKAQETMPTLSPEQLQAITLLVAGKSNTEVADTLGKERKTIYRWKQDPHFISELNRQRKEIYESGQVRLHGLLHKAITVIERQMDQENNLKSALEVLKLLNFSPKIMKADFETDPETIAARQAEKLANNALTAAPFAQENMGIAAHRNKDLQALADDIFVMIKEKYQVPTALRELME